MSKCVECGFCCTVGVCQYGVWNEERKCCSFLTKSNKCSIYHKIKEWPEAKWNPAFGAGCSSTMFNERRDKKMEELELAEYADCL